MRFAVLGPLQVDDDGAVIDLGPRKQRALLAGLLLNASGLPTTAPGNRPDDAAHRLAAHSDAVLTVAEATGPPRPVRVRVAPGRCAGQLVLTPVHGATLDHVPPGTTAANLMAHAHDDLLGRLDQTGVVGRVDGAGAGEARTWHVPGRRARGRSVG